MRHCPTRVCALLRLNSGEPTRLPRIRRELVEAREALHGVFAGMSEEDLNLPIRWPEWPARTIRTSIPYILEHEDSHLDELRSAVNR